MLLARAVLALALTGHGDSLAAGGASSHVRAPELDRLAELIHRVAAPIVLAPDVETLDEALRHLVGSGELFQVVEEIARWTSTHPELQRLPADLDDPVKAHVDRFGPENEALLRQTLDASLEFANRSATLVAPHLEDRGANGEEFVRRALALVQRDADVERFYVGLACGLAAAELVYGPEQQPPVPAEVRGQILRRWYDGITAGLAKIDPMQAALDALCREIAATRNAKLFRLAYSTPLGIHNEPVLVVSFVFEPGTQPDDWKISREPRIRYRIETELAKLSDLPVFYEVVLATDPGPAEELLGDGV